jgi:hypothetical protein
MAARICFETVSRANHFTCVVCDSEFSSPNDVVRVLASRQGHPDCIISLLIFFTQKEMKSYVNVSFENNSPLNLLYLVETPLLISHGK